MKYWQDQSVRVAWPHAGMVGLTLVVADTGNIGHLRYRQRARCGDQDVRGRLCVVFEFNRPARAGVVVNRRFDSRVEANVFANIEFVGDKVEVSQGFRLW